jgi:PAS domain S-box-containing protein
MAVRKRFDVPIEAVLRRKVIGGVIVAVLLTVCLSFVSWHGARRAEQDAYWVAHTYEVMATIKGMSRDVLETETSARAFALSGQESVLVHYPTARNTVLMGENALRHLTADNRSQQQRLDALGPQVRAALEFGDSIIAKRRKLGTRAGSNDALEIEGFIDAVRATTEDMHAEETRLLSQRTQRAAQGQRLARIIAIVGLFIKVGSWILAFLVIDREIEISAHATSQLDTLNAGLEQRVEKRTEALRSEIAERKSAEDALHDSEERLRLALDGAQLGTWQWDLQTDELLGSPLSFKLFGLPDDTKLNFGTFLATLHPDDRTLVDESMKRALGQHAAYEVEYRVVWPDGTERWIAARGRAYQNQGGQDTHVNGILFDVTDRRHAETALRESEERFHAMANGIPQLAWTAEADGSIFWFNQRWYDYTGTTPEQTAGWDWQNVHDPAILPKVLDRWKAAIAEGTPFEMEFPLRAGDGSFSTFLTRVLPLKDADGRVVRWFGTNTDISELKHAEVQVAVQAQELARRAEELANSRVELETQTLMLQSVLDSMGEGLIAADREGNFLIWNDAANKLMGRNASNLPTEQWTPHYKVFLPDGITPCPPDRLPLVRALHGESVQVELLVEHPDRTNRVCLEVTARPLKDYQGNLRGGVAVLRDITERKTAEREVRELNQTLEGRVIERTAELKAANRELEAFTYSVSHDLRAPIRHISGFTKILVEKFRPSLPAEAQEHLHLIEQGARRMGQLVDELLKLARLGRQALEVEVTGLSSLVKDVVTLLAPEIEGRQLEWKIDELPFMECDPVLIRQVFQNLISNALKYSRPRSPAVIEIGQAEKDGEKVIFVKDNGVGFDMKYSDKLFGVFQRLHLAEDFEGTGIGLATVERIIKKHGGRVWVEAVLDRGATFFFTLGTGEHSLPEKAATAAGGSL